MFEIEKRFCNDEKLNIKLYTQPYFTDRLKLFGAYDKYIDYISMISEYFNGNDQDYLEYYNKVKDKAINYIKESEAFIHLNNADMSKYDFKCNYASTDVYKDTNIGHNFISIDMSKANFTALVHYGKVNNISFFEDYNYERFLSKFTTIPHIINSKYIRQVIFGNCNPKRQITYEKFLMNGMITIMLSLYLIQPADIYALLSDEIILKADRFTVEEMQAIEDYVSLYSVRAFPLHFEYFTLGRIFGSDAYIKRYKDGTYKLKCVSPEDAPFIYRYINGEEYQDNDFVFEYNHKLAKFMNTPKYEISYEKKVK